MSSASGDLPNLGTYVDIVGDILKTWSTCEPWAISRWKVEVIFYACCIMFVFYIYVLINIIRFIRKSNVYKNPFYNCAVVLAIGDIATLITCSREGGAQACALLNIVPRYYAWEALGVFCVDLIYTVNLVMAIYRLDAMMRMGHTARTMISTNIMLALAFLWAFSMALCCFLGLMKNISFENNHYASFFYPLFDVIRTPIQMAELSLTFVIYIAAFIQLRRIKISRSLNRFNKEYRFLIMATLIFICELVYFYCTDWIGSRIFHLGSEEFNANLNYILRPITVGITPVFYMIFSSDLRKACFNPYSSSPVAGTSMHVSPVQPINPATNTFMSGVHKIFHTNKS